MIGWNVHRPPGVAPAAALALMLMLLLCASPEAPRARAAAVTFAPIQAPPSAPRKTLFSHKDGEVTVEIGIAYKRDPANGVCSIIAKPNTPAELTVRFDQAGGVAPPDLDKVELRFEYQGQSFTLPVAGSIIPSKGEYQIPLAAVQGSIFRWLSQRMGVTFDPNARPAGLFEFEDVTLLVTVHRGTPEVVGGKIALKVVERP